MIKFYERDKDMNAPTKIKHETNIPEIYGLLQKAHHAIADTGFDIHLAHLIMLRASQINGCGFCVKMHTEEARRDGEANERLDRLIVWRHVDDFSPAEKMAFAYTEALTYMSETDDLGSLRNELREHFSDKLISAMTALIAMINLWNRMQASNH